jgi:uncharacterized protein YdhG (YjbR/CyaY superfamily)
VDAAAKAYIDGIDTDTRPLFDRIHHLIVGEFPDIEVGVSYQMPVYRRDGRSLNVGVWKHGVSIYGWSDHHARSILERHPELSSGKGTLRITRAVADDIGDAELVELVRGALDEDTASRGR